MNMQVEKASGRQSQKLEDKFLVALEAAIKRFKMYPPDHPACRTASQGPYDALSEMLDSSETVILSIIEEHLAAGGIKSSIETDHSIVADAMESVGVRSIVLRKGLDLDGFNNFVRYFASKTTRNEPWPDLKGFLEENGVKGIEVDTFRYELVSEDEKVVSVDAAIGSSGAETAITLEFARIVKEHPDLIFEFLSDETGAEKSISKRYSNAIDFNMLCKDAETGVCELQEEQILQIIAVGLKKRAESDDRLDEVDLQKSLFDVKTAVEKIKKPNMLPKIKRLLKDLRIIDDKYIDMILEGRYSQKRLALEALEKTQDNIEKGEYSEADVALIPKRLEMLEDQEYAQGLVEQLFDASVSGGESGERAESLLNTVVDSAVSSNSELTCDSMIENVIKKLHDVTVSVETFKSLSTQGIKLLHWLLDRGDIDRLAQLLGAFAVYTSEEVMFAEEIYRSARKLISEFGDGSTAMKLLDHAGENSAARTKSVFEILHMLPTQACALTLCQEIAINDRSIRLAILRLLPEFGSTAINAMNMTLSEMSIPQVTSANPMLPDSVWFQIRNIVFVAGNIGTLEAVEIIERFGDHPDPRLIEEVMIALEKIGGEKSSRLLAGYLHCNSEELRRRAASALGTLGFESSLPYLAELYDNDDRLRQHLAPIIAKIGGEKAVEILARALTREGNVFKKIFDKNLEEEQVSIVSAISRIESPKSLEKLKEFRKTMGAGLFGVFKSNVVSDNLNRAIRTLESKLSTGQNST